MDVRQLAAGLVLVGQSVFSADVLDIREYSERCADYYAKAYGVSSTLVRAIIQTESGWQPGAVSPKGAMGLMQLMPATAEHYGVTHPFYMHENIRGGVAYLADLQALFGGDLRLVVAAYAAGERPILAKHLDYSSREVYSYVERIARQYRMELMRAKGKRAMIHRFACAPLLLLASFSIEAQPRTPIKTASTAKPTAPPEQVQAQVEPIVLARSSLDDKVVALRLGPRIATSIRLPEPVNAVVIGGPENFLAEHSEREPELVTVKPVTDQPAQTNLLITTTLGHQLNLLLSSPGEQKAGSLPVDILLTYSKPKSGSFLVEESAFPASLIAETAGIGADTKEQLGAGAQVTPTVTQMVNALKTGQIATLER